MNDPAPPAPSRLRSIPRNVWALGIVSMCMDASSELVHSLLPVFMVAVLGASMASIGLVEGIAEATASVTKVFSGVLSDALGKRKLIAIIGYGLAAASKPLFPVADSVATVLAARFLDRLGKGIRGSPRDALIADATPPELHGSAYGLRQSLDTVGAVAGPLLAIGFMAALSDDVRTVLWVAVLPALISVAVLVLFVREPQSEPSSQAERTPFKFSAVRSMGPVYWAVVAIGALLMLARFSEAFLVLRANGIGLSLTLVPAVIVVMNVVYAAAAYPSGAWSDRGGWRIVLIAGLAALIAADIVLALATSIWMVMAGVALWGLHMGLTQGILSAMVAGAAESHVRGTAFGIFNFVAGGAMLAASALAGVLWDVFGPSATFGAGAGFTALALFGVLAISRKARLARPAAD